MFTFILLDSTWKIVKIFLRLFSYHLPFDNYSQQHIFTDTLYVSFFQCCTRVISIKKNRRVSLKKKVQTFPVSLRENSYSRMSLNNSKRCSKIFFSSFTLAYGYGPGSVTGIVHVPVSPPRYILLKSLQYIRKYSSLILN